MPSTNPLTNNKESLAKVLRVVVLMYHRVGKAHNAWERKYCVTPERFTAHMHHLANRGMKAVDIDDFVAWTVGAKDLPGGSFLLTFDDGFYGIYEHAMPVLRELEWPATVFLVSSLLGQRDIWCEKENPSGQSYPLLGQAEIHKMRKQGFSFQCHSRTHADLTKISDEIRWNEIAGARAELEEVLGSAVPYLAYPYGRYNERVVEITRTAGYRAGFSVQPGFNRPGIDPYKIRRLDVFGTDTPAQLMRKINLGTNDGSLSYSIRYYLERLKSRVLGTPQ
ncbi:MAG: polysaccharide deacetylase family protein [Gammaproteobacteria bacterium]